MADFIVTHDALEGFEGMTDRNGKTIDLILGSPENKVRLTVKQAGALKGIIGTLIRKNAAKPEAAKVVLHERKPKADKAADAS